MDISSNYNTHINTQPLSIRVGRKYGNLAPLGKDTVSLSGKAEEKNQEDEIFKDILFGEIESAKNRYFSSNPNATEDDFRKFYIESMLEFASNPKSQAMGEDIEFNKVIPDERRKMNLFYKNGVLLRKAPILDSPNAANAPQFVITDYLGHDKDTKSFIEVEKFFGDGELMGLGTTFVEDRHNLTYKRVYNVLDGDKMPRSSVDFNESALELRDKIDQTIPKYTESAQLKKPDKNIKLPKYLYHVTTKENYEKMRAKGRIEMSPREQLKGVYCIDVDNFKNQWNEHEAWNGNLKKDLIFNQVIRKKDSDEIVILRIPTDSLDDKKIKVRSEEDYFYAQELTYRGSLIGARAPKCVEQGYDWQTGMTNFYNDKSLEFIVGEPIDIDKTKIVYSGKPDEENLDELIQAMENGAKEETAKPNGKTSLFKRLIGG